MVLGSLDWAVMAAYIKLGLSRGMALRYGQKKIVAHTLAGLGLLLSGVVAVSAEALGFFRVAQAMHLLLGVTAVVNGAGALALAPYTSGVEGYNWFGYSAYSVLFINTGLKVLWTPITGAHAGTSGVSLAYQCWVVAHAYLFCRLFVTAVHKTCSSLLKERMRYAVGTSIASAFSLFLAYGTPGLSVGLLGWVLSIVFDLAGVGKLVHVNFRKKSKSRKTANFEPGYVGICTGMATGRTEECPSRRTVKRSPMNPPSFEKWIDADA